MSKTLCDAEFITDEVNMEVVGVWIDCDDCGEKILLQYYGVDYWCKCTEKCFKKTRKKYQLVLTKDYSKIKKIIWDVFPVKRRKKVEHK